jgi:hypothetical protein
MPADPPAGGEIERRWQEILESADIAEQVGFAGGVITSFAIPMVR